MNQLSQVVNVESLANLFLDFRYLINQRVTEVFYLNSTNFSFAHQANVKYRSLNRLNNVHRYFTFLNHGIKFGYGNQQSDTIIESWLAGHLLHQSIPATQALRKFNNRLFYLNCTGHPIISGLSHFQAAKDLHHQWITSGQIIDLQDYASGAPLKIIAAKRGMPINYLRPIDYVKTRQQFHQIMNHGRTKSRIITKLLASPDYQTALKFRSHVTSNLSLSRNEAIQRFIPPHDQGQISYNIPHLSNNYLDHVLKWSRHQNPRVTRTFLPVYNAFKNRQGINVDRLKSLNSPDFNLNVPYVKTDGKLTNEFVHFGNYFNGQTINRSKLNREHGQLFVQSKRSGNWLIKARYRIKNPRSSLINHLLPFKIRLSVKLNRLTPLILNDSTPARRCYNAIHQLIALKQPNRNVSFKLLWQLIVWQLGETLTLAGGNVIKTYSNAIYVTGLSRHVDQQILNRYFSRFSIKLPTQALVSIHSVMTNQERWRRIQHFRKQLLNPNQFSQALRFFQIIPHVKPWRHRYLFTVNNLHHHHLGSITRCFIVKDQDMPQLKIVKVTHAQWYHFNNAVNYHNQVIDQAEEDRPNGKISNYPHLTHRHVIINQRALTSFTVKERNYLYHQLDLKAYFTIFRPS